MSLKKRSNFDELLCINIKPKARLHDQNKKGLKCVI